MRDSGRGDPPAPYVMLVLGSGGRGESLLAMDQDNALIYDAPGASSGLDEWFAELGKIVSDILNDVGVSYCKGGIMAMNPEWRKSLAGWRETLGTWITKARPEDILNCDIFFDARPVHGERTLARALQREALASAKGASSFLHSIAGRAGDYESPLGWFGRFRLNDSRFDLKQGGIMPIFSTARVVALRHGLDQRSTPGRLEAAQDLDIPGAHVIGDLIDAHRILLDAILRQQLRDLEAGLSLTNKVAPAQLNAHERQELRWALEQVGQVGDLLGTPDFR